MNRSTMTALVTGGGAGIGEAICRRLAFEGKAVGVLGRDAGNTTAVAKAITDAGGKAIAVQADVADRAQVDTAVARVRKALGSIGILVNNAGIEDFTVGDIDYANNDIPLGGAQSTCIRNRFERGSSYGSC